MINLFLSKLLNNEITRFPIEKLLFNWEHLQDNAVLTLKRYKATFNVTKTFT